MRLVFMFGLCSLLLALPAVAADPTNPPPTVTLAWGASPGTNVIVEYTLYWGGSTANYTNHVHVGTALTATVTDLTRGRRYFFAATAKDNNGLESVFSNEVSTTIPSVPVAPSGLTITLTQ